MELRAKILEEAENQGLPLHAPVELHIISSEGLEEYTRRGKVISVNDVMML